MRLLLSLAALVSVIASSSVAQAQSFRSYVAQNGTDTGNCPAQSPCRTFDYAYTKTDAGGEIACLGPGTYSTASATLTITKTITINCVGTIANVATEYFGGSITINTAASDRVVLRGLDILSSQSISFQGAGTLILDQMKLTASGVEGSNALVFQPGGAGKLVIQDSIFAISGITYGGGIVIRPFNSGTAQVTLNRVTVAGNAFGVAADGSASTGGINVTINDSVMTSNANDGVVATTSPGKAPIGITVSNSTLSNNGYGARSIGPNVTVRVDTSRITGNGTALTALSGGALLTGGGNTVQANAFKGAFTGSYALE